jgi:uncharacterized linocin/CFP29 family protein
MDDRNAQVGWTEAQWNRVREEVLREWQRARVAGSFLPIYGPLPPSTQVVPSELLNDDGSVDDTATIRLLELRTTFALSQQQVSDPDLSNAVLQFRRAAIGLARLEDVAIFSGQTAAAAWAAPLSPPPDPTSRRPSVPATLAASAGPARAKLPEFAVDGITATTGPWLIGPGGAQNTSPYGLVAATPHPPVTVSPMNGQELVKAIPGTITLLESVGYGAPFVCVLGRGPYIAAHDPTGALVLPADRIEPMLGRQLLRASALDVDANGKVDAAPRAVVLSLAGDPIDLVVAVSASPQFTQVDTKGKYSFRVFERFVLRIKDPAAIVRLDFA